MSISRKCPNCLHWNKDEDHCTACATALNPDIIRDTKEALRKAENESLPKPVLDQWFDQMRNSRWWLVRAVFWIGYSVWLVFFGILSFFIALIAWTPG